MKVRKSLFDCTRYELGRVGIDVYFAVKLENLQYDELVRLYDEAMNNRKPIQKQLQAATDKMYHEAEDGLRTLNL